MVSKRELQKNKIDLEFKAESQKANIYLTLGTITVIGFITGMFIQRQYIIGGVFGFVLSVSAFVLHRRTKSKMKEILDRLDEL